MNTILFNGNSLYSCINKSINKGMLLHVNVCASYRFN